MFFRTTICIMGFNYISDDSKIVVFESKLTEIYGSPFNIEAE